MPQTTSKQAKESNNTNPSGAANLRRKENTIDLVKRGNHWYMAVTATREHAESDDIHVILWLCQNGFDRENILAKGQQTKYHKMNISFGFADYYYDYSF